MALDAQPQTANVTFEPQAFAALQELASRQGKSISQTLGDALALQKYFLDTRQKGGKILVQQNGNIIELQGLTLDTK
ncbi:MAG TPA: hypothetical protein DEV93_07110 [Chloroflexi bacterium]|nr:hypothetical protein [Chloroflexota bacterium]